MRLNGVMLTIGSAAALAALSWVGLSRAQQPGSEPRTADRMEMRSRLARLRAEVDLKRAEHDAARSHLLEILKRAEQVEFVRRTETHTPEGLAACYFSAITGDQSDGESMLKAAIMARASAGEGDDGQLREAAKKDLKKSSDGLLAAIDRAKKEFLDQGTVLEEKGLELSDLEAQFRQAK